jgi:hypothetical protein
MTNKIKNLLSTLAGTLRFYSLYNCLPVYVGLFGTQKAAIYLFLIEAFMMALLISMFRQKGLKFIGLTLLYIVMSFGMVRSNETAYMLEIEMKNEPIRKELYQKFEEIKMKKKAEIEKEISECKAEMAENQEKRDYGASGKWLEILDKRDITHREAIRKAVVKLNTISAYEPQSLEELREYIKKNNDSPGNPAYKKSAHDIAIEKALDMKPDKIKKMVSLIMSIVIELLIGLLIFLARPIVIEVEKIESDSKGSSYPVITETLELKPKKTGRKNRKQTRGEIKRRMDEHHKRTGKIMYERDISECNRAYYWKYRGILEAKQNKKNS